jgi:hypothetical protein
MEIKSYEVTIKINHPEAEQLRSITEILAQTLSTMIEEFPTKQEKDQASYSLMLLLREWGVKNFFRRTNEIF